jgi:putative ABC transport system permease protein
MVILRHLRAERLRTLTTVVAIAAGLAVIVAVRLTNVSSVRGFQAAVELVSGRTSLEIVGASGAFDERVLGDLGWLRAYGDVSPVIDAELVALPPGGARPERLRLLGVDILREPPFRQYGLSQSEVASGTQRFLELMLDPQAIILTEKFARQAGLRVGDTLRLAAGDRVGAYTIQGLLRDEGPARALDGHFALMDIAAAQLAVGRLGLLDRIDLRTAEGAAIDAAAAAIAARLPPGLTVQRPADRTAQVEKMLQAFHLNLQALSYVALLVGLFLIYNTVAVSVIARREEIGMLRALGVSRRRVRVLFLCEAGLLGGAGCVLGIGAGRLLAHAAIGLTATTVQTLYVATAAAPPDLTVGEAALAAAVALPLAILAGLVPANEAARVPPVAAMGGRDPGEGDAGRAGAGRWRSVGAAMALLAAAVWMGCQPAIDGRPLFGWGAAVCVVFGAACLVPLVLEQVTRLVGAGLRHYFHLESWLANANLAAGIRRVAISVAALAMSLSMLVAIAVMIGSFRETVQYWVAQTLRADLYVSSGGRPSGQADFTVSPEAEALVRTHPAVAAVDVFRRDDLRYEGAPITLAAGDYRVILEYGNLLFKAPAGAREAMRRAIGMDAVVVSEPFAMRHGKQPGDAIDLPTPRGPVAFRIAAVYFDYSADRGVVVLDRATFARHFGERRPTSLAVYLRPGASADRVRAALLDRLGADRRLFIQTNQSLRREVLRIFDSTFAITYALEGVAIVVAMMGVATTLLTLILDRRREIAVLRLVGAGRRQVSRMVVIEALLIGGVSQAVGLIVGLALSLILIFVINAQSFGWTIQWHMPWRFLLQASLVMQAATLLAGLFPARRAARIEWAEQLTEA